MYNFAQRRNLYFLLSAVIIIPGLIAMGYSIAEYGSPVRLSIDFTGGTLLEIPFVSDVSEQAVRDSLTDYGLDDYVVQRLDPEGVVGNPADIVGKLSSRLYLKRRRLMNWSPPFRCN